MNKNITDMDESPAIGIDLGTTYSSVGVWRQGKVEIIANDQGNRTTPSYVAFTDTDHLIGDAAKNQVAINPSNTVFNVKRWIGRKYNDPNIAADIKHWPFKVVNVNGNPQVQVEFKGQAKKFVPEEVCSMILTKMKETAETYLGCTVNKAVISVPAYFNNAQRQATIDAAAIARLEVLRIINEPSAAVVPYGMKNHVKGERIVLVFDLGGGTLDVSIVIIEDYIYEVIATAGDTNLGGEDFNNRLVHHLAEKFKRKYTKHLDPRALQRLRTAAEIAKHTLSSSIQTTIKIDNLFEGIDFVTKLSRVKFEQMCADLFCRTLRTVQRALQDAKILRGIDKEHIDDIVLVGGSTRIPKIQSLLQDFFCGKALNLMTNPDEPVAYGAAVWAAVLTGSYSSSSMLDNSLILDLTPLSMGIETTGGVMSRIVERHQQIPTRITQIFTSADTESADTVWRVFEGEEVLTKDNNLLGTLRLTGIPPSSRELSIQFEVDPNGILNVSAYVNSVNVTTEFDKDGLSQSDIDKMINKAKTFREELEKSRERIAARSRLESFVFTVKNQCNESLRWLENNTLVEKEEYEDKLKELASSFSGIMSNLHGGSSEEMPGYCGQ